MRHLLLLFCVGVLSLNTYSQSKLQGAGKASRVGETTSTQKKPTTSVKPSQTKKIVTSSSQIRRSSNDGGKHTSGGYMEVLDISFANTDGANTIIDNYDGKLYAKEVKYLTPKISYNGLSSEEKLITLNIKVIDEDGNLKTGTSSPEGFTYSKDVKVEPGKNKHVVLSGWGNAKGGSYGAGLYKMEIWYKEKMLYEKEVRLYSGSTPIASNGILSINSISFANTDEDGNILNDYGQPLYDGQVQYLKPKIYYYGKYSSNQEVVLYVRYFKSSGDLVSGTSSPTGFSFKESVTIKPGANNVTLSGFGNKTATNYKEGTCKVEVWMDGEKLYETEISIKKAGSSSYSGNDSAFLKSILEKPMGKANCNPITDSYYTIKNSLSSIYSINTSSDNEVYKITLSPSGINSTQDLTYHGLSFSYFFFSIYKENPSRSLMRRISYDFEVDKTQMGSLDDAYACMNRIVKDFNNIGINISYQKKNEAHTKAQGSVYNGNIEYEITLDEYSSSYKFVIDAWVWKK